MLEEEENEDAAQEKETSEENVREQDKGLLTYWAISMEENVDIKLKDENGDGINPRNCPKFATPLLKQVKTIPLWSCIRRNNFKYGRIPASSAPVESEFKTIKKQILPKPKRTDVVVESLVRYYNGKLKLVECSNRFEKEIEKDSQNKSQGPENVFAVKSTTFQSEKKNIL